MGPSQEGWENIFQVRKVERLWEIAEAGDLGKKREKRKVMREGSRKQQEVGCFCWLLPEFGIAGIAGTGLELNGVWERNS